MANVTVFTIAQSMNVIKLKMNIVMIFNLNVAKETLQEKKTKSFLFPHFVFTLIFYALCYTFTKTYILV